MTVVLANKRGDDRAAGPAAMEVGVAISSEVYLKAPDGRDQIRGSAVSTDGPPLSSVVRFNLGTATAGTNPLDTVLSITDSSRVLARLFVVGALLAFA